MSSWTERMASVVAACGPRQPSSGLPYHRRLEKVKFGVPLDQVCKRDIPGPLLVMLLKLNKEGPFKKDVFRAPGHQGNMKKLIHFLQQGRLVNIHSFSVNTIASVLKKFLRKLPGGIFGPDNEAELFRVIKAGTEQEKLVTAQRIFMSLPVYSQHLLVLLFGTFRVIHSNSERAKTGMTAEALGVSVAPSFFHTCVSEGKIAKPEEVNKFKLATKITTFFIEHFGMRDLLGRENYEYYARLTGRILKVEDEWIFFTYPPVIFGGTGPDQPATESGLVSLGGPGGGTSHHRAKRRDSDPETAERASAVGGGVPGVTGGVVVAGSSMGVGANEKSGSLEIIPESCPLDPNGRLSISLDDHNVSSPSSCGSHPLHSRSVVTHHADFREQTGVPLPSASQTEDGIKLVMRGETGTLQPEIQKSYTCLPQWDQSRRHSSACSTNWKGLEAGDEDEVFTTRGGGRVKDDSGDDLGPDGIRLPPPPKDIIHIRRIKARTIEPNTAVHQRQTERMRHRSEWFLSDPTGLVTVKCRPDRPSSLGPNQLTPPPLTPSPAATASPGQIAAMTAAYLSASAAAASTTPSRMTTPTPKPLPPPPPASARLGRSPSSSPRFFSSPMTPSSASSSTRPPPLPSLSSSPYHTTPSAAAVAICDTSSNLPISFQQKPLRSGHHQGTLSTSPSPPSQQLFQAASTAGSGSHSVQATPSSSSAAAFLPQPHQSPTATAASNSLSESPLHLVTQASTTHSIQPNSNQSVHSLNFPAGSPASLPTSAGGPNGPNNNSRLRRRLSDKDKERRLVRRSSSKRKDKENGVSGGSAAKISASSGSLDKGSSGALTPQATAATAVASGTPVTETGAIHHAGDSGPASIESAVSGRVTSRAGIQLSRAGSADAGGTAAAVASQFRSAAAAAAAASDHPALCRTGSQDHPPHVELPAVLARSGSAAAGTAATGSASPLTRSLPRI